MAKLSKRVRAFREKVDANQSYPLDEAVALIKEFGTAKFNETVEVAVNLGVDARKSDQGVRGATTLPHGRVQTSALRSLPRVRAPKRRRRWVLSLSEWKISPSRSRAA